MDAQELLHDALVIDLHNDTIVAHIRRGNWSLFADGVAAQAGADRRHAGTISFVRGPERPAPAPIPSRSTCPKCARRASTAAFSPST